MGALDIYSTPMGRFLLDPDDGVQAHIAFSGSPWDAWIQPYMLQFAPGQLCYDIGAHVGSMSMLMIQAGATQVRAYEPQRRLYEQLRVTALLNSSKLIPCQEAVWDELGVQVGIATELMEQLCLHNPDWRVNSPGGIAFRHGSEENSLLTTTIDIEAKCFGAPGFIKIDAQGADLLVLRGGQKVITEAHPAIIFEFEKELAQDLHGHSWQDYLDFFEGVGYTLTPCDPSNFLALPKEG